MVEEEIFLIFQVGYSCLHIWSHKRKQNSDDFFYLSFLASCRILSNFQHKTFWKLKTDAQRSLMLKEHHYRPPGTHGESKRTSSWEKFPIESFFEKKSCWKVYILHQHIWSLKNLSFSQHSRAPSSLFHTSKKWEEKKVFLSHFLQKKRVNLISLNTRKTQTFNQTYWSRTRNSKQKGRRSNSHCNNEHKTDNTKATF